MSYKILPPKSWLDPEKNSKKFNIYNEIFEKYKDNDILFKVIKKDGKIKLLNKINCKKYIEYFSNLIKENIALNSNKKQSKIMAIISASEESLVFMLSSLRLGTHHCICFEDLSEIAILKRIEIFKPQLIVCKSNLISKIRNVLDKFNDKSLSMLVIDIDNIKDFVENNSSNKSYDDYYHHSSLFTLFTSGSTGTPKAITHNVRDYLDYAKYSTNYFFGIKKRSTIFTAVDAGWINGHTYAFYGPLLLGAISIVNENPILISMPELLSEYLANLKVDCFYTSVTQLRLIKSLVSNEKRIFDFTKKEIHLERIGSCGEPLAHSVGEWASKFFAPKRLSIVNTYFQTETGGILVAPRDEDGFINDYSCVGKPNNDLGINIASKLMSKSNLEKEGLDPNELLVCKKWKGIFKEIISDRKSKYFTEEGFFRLSDIGYFDKEGYLYIGGRSDDVINVSGHRISSSEIESVSLSFDTIIDSCAVSIPDNLSGNRVILFINSNENDLKILNIIKSEIKQKIKNDLSSFHLPKEIYFFKNLPKTKSGKIMRRIMRDLANKKSFDKSQDYSTLINMNKFLESRNNFMQHSDNKTVKF